MNEMFTDWPALTEREQIVESARTYNNETQTEHEAND